MRRSPIIITITTNFIVIVLNQNYQRFGLNSSRRTLHANMKWERTQRYHRAQSEWAPCNSIFFERALPCLAERNQLFSANNQLLSISNTILEQEVWQLKTPQMEKKAPVKCVFCVKMSAGTTWLTKSRAPDARKSNGGEHRTHTRIVFANAPNSLKFWARYHYTVKVFITSWRHQLCAIQIGLPSRGKTCAKRARDFVAPLIIFELSRLEYTRKRLFHSFNGQK